MSLYVLFFFTSSILLFTISLCFYHPPNIFKLQIREPIVFPISFCLMTNHSSVTSKTPCSFHFCIIHCLYPLVGLPAYHNNLFPVHRPLCSDSSRMTIRLPLSNYGTPARQRTFPCNLSLFMSLFSVFWICISLVRSLVNFRLHNHLYFY